MRPSGRQRNQMREVRLTPHFTRHAEGSVLAEFGDTRVLCTASVKSKVPPFLKGKGQGWVTAEYGMLPRATHTRTQREAARGSQSGRTLEIQRLIGRSLRAVVDRAALGENTITIDCDVLQADGGTRTAAITGGYVALALAAARLVGSGKIARDPVHGQVAAVSVGIFRGQPVLDLDYTEDSEAETDMNVVMNDAKGFIEVQGTAEGHALQRSELDLLLDLAAVGIEHCSRRRPPFSGSEAGRALGARDEQSRQSRGALGAAGRSGSRSTRDGSVGARRQRAARKPARRSSRTLCSRRATQRGRRGCRPSPTTPGLIVAALGGAPAFAPRGSRASGPTTAPTSPNFSRLLDAPSLDRSARFHCVLVALEHAEDAAPLIATGIVGGADRSRAERSRRLRLRPGLLRSGAGPHSGRARSRGKESR